MKIQADQIGSPKFQLYKTYMFANPKNMPASNFSFSEENQKFLFEAVAFEMNTRGYESTKGADLIIRLQGGTSIETERGAPPPMHDPMMFRPGFGPYYHPYGYRMYDDISKKQTTIIVDILEAQTEKLIWQGVASGVLTKKKDDVELKIREAVKDIFEKYPFKAGVSQ
ncbi:MAG: DUF4136 domain-containing protein [Cyclobacteriaceae bacterium]|nr:DUF4136 domain-containing protein [Cyclobacteriaceae bacterium]